MTYKSILLGLSAIGAAVLAGPAIAQAPAVPAVPAVPGTPATPTGPAVRAAPAVPATPAAPAAPAPNAAAASADASANTAAAIPAGTVVRDSSGAELGVVMAPDPSITSAGRVTIKTGTGFITLPANSLRLEGDVAISTATEPVSPQ